MLELIEELIEEIFEKPENRKAADETFVKIDKGKFIICHAEDKPVEMNMEEKNLREEFFWKI